MKGITFTHFTEEQLKTLIKEAIREEQAHQPTKPENENIFLNLEEFCKYTGFSRSHAYKLTSNRKVPFYKRGKSNYFKKSEIDKSLLLGRRSHKILGDYWIFRVISIFLLLFVSFNFQSYVLISLIGILNWISNWKM